MTAAANSPLSTPDVRIRPGLASDVDALTRLINAAFIVERAVFEGDRVNRDKVSALLNTGTFLLLEDGQELAGCVFIETRGDRAYLGLLSVDPARQGLGLGRRLAQAAEDFARGTGARVMDLRVISARSELLPFYQRLGYAETGTSPFPADLARKAPSHYIHMSKSLA